MRINTDTQALFFVLAVSGDFLNYDLLYFGSFTFLFLLTKYITPTTYDCGRMPAGIFGE